MWSGSWLRVITGKKGSTQKQAHIESVRAAWPGSYRFNIQSFSLIPEIVQESAGKTCFESPVFESNGHKWKLSIYPNGNKKLGVTDHISMYLVAADDDIDTVETGINVTFKMFIYDHIRDNFLTIEDNEAVRFHGLKKEWDFDRLISIKRFKNAKNGYLMNDRCVFGVEIFVIPSVVTSGNLSMIKQPDDGIVTWKLHNFSTLKKDVTSTEFKIQGHAWKAKVHIFPPFILLEYINHHLLKTCRKLDIRPNGSDGSEKGTHLSMYLWLLNNGKHKIYLNYVLRIRNQITAQHHEMQGSTCFEEISPCWGFHELILLSKLKDKSSGFIFDDTLIVEVEFKLISK